MLLCFFLHLIGSLDFNRFFYQKIHCLLYSNILGNLLFFSIPNHLFELIYFHSVHLSHFLQLFVNVLIRCLNLFRISYCLQDKTCFNTRLRLRSHLIHQRLRLHACHLHILLYGKPLLLKAGSKLIYHLGYLLIYHRSRKINLCIFYNLQEYLIFFLCLHLSFSSVRQGLFHTCFVFLQRIKFGNLTGKFIIQFRKLFDFYFLDLHLEQSRFTLQTCFMIFLWERNIDIHFITGLLTDQLIFKGVNKGMASDGQRIIRSLATFKWLTVYKSLKVNNCDVIFFDLSVFYCHDTGVLLTNTVNLRIDIRCQHLDFLLFYLNSLVISQLYLWLHCNGLKYGEEN